MASGTEIAKAYVQLMPSMRGIKGRIGEELGGEGHKGGVLAGNRFAGAVKKIIAAAAIGKFFKDSIMEGANLEQSFGGLETIYGQAAAAAKSYAAEAAKAGISANNYAEQAVSFGASLKQAFGGDSTKAVEAANTAIMDMTDNAAKMGTRIEEIQRAYQGFSRGQYGMLDNLKLGYGGTISEMERLLADAQKISGIEYNIDNLGDVYDAIHVIQGELGLTGVAAAEAKETLSGSFGAMKAAAKNFMAFLATGEDVAPAIKQMVEYASAFLFDNLIPAIGRIITTLPGAIATLIASAGPSLAKQGMNLINFIKNGVTQKLPDFMKTAKEMIPSFVGGFTSSTTQLIDATSDLVDDMVAGIKENLPKFAQSAGEMINAFVSEILGGVPKVLESLGGMASSLVDGFTDLLPSIQESAKTLIDQLVSTIKTNVPMVIRAAGDFAISLFDKIMDSLPQWLSAGISLLESLRDGILEALPSIVSSLAELAGRLLAAFVSRIPDFLQMGLSLIVSLAAGIIQGIPKLLALIPEAIGGFIRGVLDADPGASFIDVIVSGIYEKGIELIQAAGDAVISFVDGILTNLPQMLTAGYEMITNLISGIIDNLPSILGAAASLIASLVSGMLTYVPQLIGTIISILGRLVATIISHLPQLLAAGVSLIVQLAAGLVQAIPQLIGKIPSIISSVTRAFTSVNWGSVGRNIISGIANGLRAAGSALWNAVKGVLGNFKDKVLGFFGIHSPSRWGIYVGEMIDKGLANGIADNTNMISRASEKMLGAIADPVDYGVHGKVAAAVDTGIFGAPTSANVGAYGMMGRLEEAIERLKNAQTQASFYLDGRKFAVATASPISEQIEADKKIKSMINGVRL